MTVTVAGGSLKTLRIWVRLPPGALYSYIVLLHLVRLPPGAPYSYIVLLYSYIVLTIHMPHPNCDPELFSKSCCVSYSSNLLLIRTIFGCSIVHSGLLMSDTRGCTILDRTTSGCLGLNRQSLPYPECDHRVSNIRNPDCKMEQSNTVRIMSKLLEYDAQHDFEHNCGS
jgi:hypothetical protein